MSTRPCSVCVAAAARPPHAPPPSPVTMTTEQSEHVVSQPQSVSERVLGTWWSLHMVSA